MYSYEIKPTLCSQLVVSNTHNQGELCITISGDKGEPYVSTIIPKEKMDIFFNENSVEKMELKQSQCFAYSYEFRPFACTGFEMQPLNSNDFFILTLYSDYCCFIKRIPIDQIIQPVNPSF
ncbi:hypothetical protein [Bartonella raoultii]|uniref:hypothetical protein n=1 Tax=Bartonella raoultii TaxID=1457020 RepID=UPI001ABA84FD|nr:hypothetical protein [Bartonella raoultii]